MELPPIAMQIWDSKYRLKAPDGEPIDQTSEDTLRRVANFLAWAEHPAADRSKWADKFFDAMRAFEFIPAGRIIAGAGAGRNVTLSNCYTMGTIPDSMEGIFTHLREAALTMQAGGGIGYDFSPIRPKGALVKGVGAEASGPLSFMDCWDSMCRTVMSAGSRRGAMMATMRCDHPDIFDFIAAKHDPAKLRMFNLSVLVTDAFMQAVNDNADWALIHEKAPADGDAMGLAAADGSGRTTYVWDIVKARDLWDAITRNTYDHAEPGVIFIDRVNRLDNMSYAGTISTTNPCGEEPMQPYESCLLGSINLAKFVQRPFQKNSAINLRRLKEVVRVAVRMMDNVVDLNWYPLPAQKDMTQRRRRIGLGITGLADMLLMLGVRYGSEEAACIAEEVMKTITRTAYEASVDLAKEKGPFPDFDAAKYLGGESFAAVNLPPHVKVGIRQHGIRNALLTSIAPTGTISLFAGNVSSGMEPIFAPSYTRKVLQPDGTKREELVVDYALRLRQELGYPDHDVPETEPPEFPPGYVDAQSLTPAEHVRMQGALQAWVDSSISKTINLPESISFEDFQSVYRMAWDQGCKGCTTYRPNPVTGSVLSIAEKPVEAPEPPPAGMGAEDAFPPSPALAARPDALAGTTYKVKLGEHALYITITDHDGRPFEIFIATKNPEHQAWVTALTRMVSAIFRRGGDVSFVAEELKAVFDPKGGGWWNGRYWPSEVAVIGQVIADHLARKVPCLVAPEGLDLDKIRAEGPEQIMMPVASAICPRCYSPNLKHEAGCVQCLDCGHSTCG